MLSSLKSFVALKKILWDYPFNKNLVADDCYLIFPVKRISNGFDYDPGMKPRIKMSRKIIKFKLYLLYSILYNILYLHLQIATFGHLYH